jgi:hypothetical protein
MFRRSRKPILSVRLRAAASYSGSAKAMRLHSRALLAAVGWKPNDNG